MRDTRDQLEGVVASLCRLPAVPTGQEPAHAYALLSMAPNEGTWCAAVPLC
jgi:hypothetical protein